MALTYDYRAIKGFDTFTDIEHQLLGTMTFRMMAIDMNSITKHNLKEVLFRCLFLDTYSGAVFHKVNGAKISPKETKELLTSWIGLSTNVAEQSRAKFLRRWSKVLEREIQHIVSNL